MPSASKLSIENFKSTLVSGGVRPTMFVISVTFPDELRSFFQYANVGLSSQNVLDQLTFLCKAASIPASTLTTVNVGLPAGGQLKLPGSRLFDPWTTTIISDGQMAMRSVIEYWMQTIIDHESQLSVMDLDRYMATANVTQLDREGKSIREYELLGLYPTSLDAIDLSFDSIDTIQEFQCVWNYHYWEAKEPNGSSSVDRVFTENRFDRFFT